MRRKAHNSYMDKMLFDPFVGGKRISHYIKSMRTDSYSILTLQKDNFTYIL